jgi:NAD(P)-dependent dehydrogenase (short-subunit alcohol dehydrogenase family)
VALSRHTLICGAWRGLGLGLVQAFLQAGWHVHAVVRADAGPSLDAALGEQRLSCMLSNAGVYGPAHQNPRKIDADEIAELFLANAVAPIRLAQQLAERAVERGAERQRPAAGDRGAVGAAPMRLFRLPGPAAALVRS